MMSIVLAVLILVVGFLTWLLGQEVRRQRSKIRRPAYQAEQRTGADMYPNYRYLLQLCYGDRALARRLIEAEQGEWLARVDKAIQSLIADRSR